MSKILLLVDVQNLFYSVRDNFGTKARVDFKKLIEVARNNREEDVKPIAYIAQYSERHDKTIIGALKAVGYLVNIKHVKKRHGKFVRTDLDSDMILDCMDLVSTEEINTVVVASGDSDFVPLYERLKEREIRVEVLSFQDSLSKDLMHVADDIRLLGRTVLFDDDSLAGIKRHGSQPEDDDTTRSDDEDGRSDEDCSGESGSTETE